MHEASNHYAAVHRHCQIYGMFIKWNEYSALYFSNKNYGMIIMIISA